MAFFFTNKNQRQLQFRKDIQNYYKTYNIGKSTPADVIQPKFDNVKSYITVHKAYLDALNGSSYHPAVNDKIIDRHIAMNTFEAKGLYYYLSMYGIGDTFALKDGIPSEQIIQSAIKFDNIMYQYATDRFNSKNRSAVAVAKQNGITAFDLETLGDDSITDFHFEKVGPGGFDSNNRTYFSSALGITFEQKEKFEQTLEEWKRSGKIDKLSEEQKITLNRLNKIGSTETIITTRDASKALYRYEQLDSVAELSEERIRRGIERLYDMGAKQTASAVNGIRPAVNEMIEGYYSSNVLGGHNIKAFDIPKVYNFFNDRDKNGNLRFVTQEEHELFNNKHKANAPQYIDSFHIARQIEKKLSMAEIAEQLRNPAFQKHNAGYNSQSGVIIRNNRTDLLEGASLHAAEHDTLLWIQGIYETDFIKEYNPIQGATRTLQPGSILAVGNVSLYNNALKNDLIFERNGYQQDLRFSSGFVYKNGKEHFVQNALPVVETKMNYMLAGLSKVTTTANASLEKIGLANKDLYVASLVPMLKGADNDSRYFGMQNSVITIAAETQDELEEKLANFVYVGQRKGIDKNTDIAMIRQEASKGILDEDILSIENVSNELREITDMYDQASWKKIDRTIGESLNVRVKTKIEEDLPARRTRGTEFSFWSKLIAISDKISQNVSKNNKATISYNDMESIVSYTIGGKRHYQTSTMRNLAFAKEYAQAFEPVARAAMQRVSEYKPGGQKPAFEFVYKHILDAIRNKAGISGNIHATEIRELSADEMNIFDIDLESLIHRAGKVSKQANLYEEKPSNIVSIKMNGIDYRFADNVMRAIYGSDSKDISPVDRKKTLHNVMKLLNKQVKPGLFSRSEMARFVSDRHDELSIVTFIGEKLRSHIEALRAAGQNTKQFLYTRNKQTLDEQANELIKQGIMVKDSNGKYTLSNAYGNIDTYADDALRAYKAESIQKLKDTNNKIDDIIEKILFKESDVSKKDLVSFGYTEVQADLLLAQREIRKRDTKELLKLTFGTILDSNAPKAALSYDENTGLVSIITQGEQIEADISRYLPKDVWNKRTGKFYTRLGGMDIVLPVGIMTKKDYKTGELSEISYGSALRQAINDRGWIKYSLHQGIEEGNAVDNLIGIFKDINKHLRTSPLGPGTSAYVDLRQIINNLPELATKGIITKEYVEEDLIQTALGFAGKEVDIAKGVGVSYYQRVFDNMRGILRSIAANGKTTGLLDPNVSTDDIISIANNIIIGDKPNAHGFAETVLVNGVITRDNRGIGSAVARTLSIDIEKIEDPMVQVPNELKKKVRSVENLIRTEAEVNRESQEKDYRQNVVVRRYNVRHEVLKDKLKDDKVSNITRQILGRNTYTAEGGGIINPFLADTIFASQVSNQKIKFSDLADLDHIDKKDIQKEELVRRKKYGYHIRYDSQTGEYKFEYGAGKYIQTNDTIAITFDDYIGFQATKAKHEGIVKTVFFDRDAKKIVDEKMINTIIKDWVKTNKIQAKTDEERREIITLISNDLARMFDRKIINTAFEANTYVKMIENQAEKGMRFSPIAGLGDVDNRISAFLEKIGAKKLVGRGLSVDAIKELFGGENEFRALTAFTRQDGKPNSSANIKQAIYDIFNTTNEKDLLSAIMKERYKPFNEFAKLVLGKGGETIGIISNNAADALKHNEIQGAFSYLFAQINGLEDDNVRERLVSEINKRNVFGKGNDLRYSQKNGFIMPNNIDYVDINKLSESIKATTGQEIDKDTWNYLNGINSKAYYDNVILARADDHEKASYSSTNRGFKYTKRDAENMIMNTYDDESLKVARKRITEATGDKNLAVNLFAERINDHHAVYDDVALNLRDKIFASDYNDLVLKDGQIQKKHLHRFAKNKNLDERYLSSILARMRSARNIDTTYLEKAYMADMHLIARNYNLDTGKISDEALKKYNFQSMNIGELVTSKGSNEFFSTNMYGKNLLIDLSDIGLVTSKGKSKLAIPILATGFMSEDKEATSEVLNKLAALNSRAKEYIGLEDIDEDTKNIYKRTMQKSLTQIEALLESRHGKEGPIAEMSARRLAHSSSASKVQIIDLASLSEDNVPWKFKGKSLAGMAEKGLEVNAVFVSENRFREMLGQDYFDALKKAGVSEEEWFTHVEEHGVIGTVNRKPSAYKGSMSTARIYLDRTMKGGQTKVSQSLAFPMHADIDGDIVGVSIITEAGKTTNNNFIEVDSAMHEILSDKQRNKQKISASVKLEKDSFGFIGRRMNRIDNATLYESATTGYSFMQSVKAPNAAPQELPKQNLLVGFLINGRYYREAFGADREKLEKTWEALGQHDDFRGIINQKSEMDLLDFKIEVEDQIKKTFGNTSQAHNYEAALGHYLNEAFAKRATMAYAGKEGTGLVNYHVQKFRTVLAAMIQSGENPLNARQESIVNTALIAFEDKFFGAKNAGKDMSQELDTLGKVSQKALGPNNDPGELINFLIKDFDILKEKWMTKAFGNNPVTEQEFASTFETFLPAGKGLSAAVLQAMKTGMGTGANSPSVTYFLKGEYDAAAAYFQGISKEHSGLVEEVDHIIKDNPSPMYDSNSIEFPQMQSSAKAQKGLKDSFVDVLKNTKVGMKGSLAKSAVGIAGAIMLTGFIGGNPSRDEDEIALNNEMAHRKNPGYVPSMNQYNRQQMSSPGGYKVNIKASSPYDARRSTAAINQSFSQHTSGNINMNMNINNRAQGPSRREMNDYFERAI